MPEKQRGEIDFSYKKGFFRDYSSMEPLQLYHFFEREGYSLHRTETPIISSGILLLFCVCGEATLTVDDRTLSFSEGNVILLNVPKECVITSSDPSSLMHYIGIEMSVFERISPHASSGELCRWYLEKELPLVAYGVEELYSVFSSIIDELSTTPRYGTMLVRGMLYQTLVLVYRRAVAASSISNDEEVHSVQSVGHTVYAIIRYVDEHLYSMDHLTGMAKELGYSYNYLSHLFRKKTGMTIQAYVSRKKIEKSKELLLQQHLSITEVAALLNYDCIQSFSKAFKRAMNMSPTEYRTLYGWTEVIE